MRDDSSGRLVDNSEYFDTSNVGSLLGGLALFVLYRNVSD